MSNIHEDIDWVLDTATWAETQYPSMPATHAEMLEAIERVRAYIPSLEMEVSSLSAHAAQLQNMLARLGNCAQLELCDDCSDALDSAREAIKLRQPC